MKENNYLQNCSGTIYKVMDKYLLQISPWEQNSDRRVFEYNLDDMQVITYQNACMIVNKQFSNIDEEWEHNGKKYIARKTSEKNIDEHTALISMLPSHYVKTNSKMLMDLPDNNSISLTDNIGNEFKMVKHKGKIYYALLINQYLPKVQIYDTFGKFCQMVNIKNIKPIFSVTDKKYI